MANYVSTHRTNMFRVTDEEKFKDIIKHLQAESDIEVFEASCGDEKWFGFGSTNTLKEHANKNEDDCDPTLDEMGELQKIIPENEAIMITDIGYEDGHYIGAGTLVITKNASEYVSLNDVADQLASKLLGGTKYTSHY